MPVAACPPQPSVVTYVDVRSTLGVPVSIRGGGRDCAGFSGAFDPQRHVRDRRALPARLRIDQRVPRAAATPDSAWHWVLRPRGGRPFTALELRAVYAGGWVLQARAAGGAWVSSVPIAAGGAAAPRGAAVIGTIAARRVQARPVGSASPSGRMQLVLEYASAARDVRSSRNLIHQPSGGQHGR